MITMRMQGGFGNQLFQYATGYAISKACGTDLALDISSYKFDRMRQFNLDLFMISNRIVFGSVPTVSEYALDYDPMLVNRVSDGAVLSGYFQDERYFSNVRQELTDLFQPRKPLPFGYEGYLDKIKTSNSVAMTIRRTDYLQKLGYHGVLEPGYYFDALHWLIRSTPLGLKGIDLFIFSDDINWCKSNCLVSDMKGTVTFIENDMTTRDHLGREDADIYLMKHCKGHILANSTFSWWGCWLSNSNFVVAPKNWYADSTIKTSIVPERWMQI